MSDFLLYFQFIYYEEREGSSTWVREQDTTHHEISLFIDFIVIQTLLLWILVKSTGQNTTTLLRSVCTCFVSREDANYSNPIFSEKTSPNVQQYTPRQNFHQPTLNRQQLDLSVCQKCSTTGTTHKQCIQHLCLV